MRCAIICLSLSVVLLPAPASGGLVITLNDLGGSNTNLVGAGTLASIMQEAADVWELAFADMGFNHALTVNYQFGALAGGTLGSHSLTNQGGTPNRETTGFITINNTTGFFADGTLNGSDPFGSGNSEYSTFSTTSSDLGGGTINTSRQYSGASGDAAGRFDLFTVAIHEIGHALGLSAANNTFIAETADGDIDVGGGFPFTGSVITVAGGAHIPLGNNLMGTSLITGVRRLPSAADILANAWLSQFTNPDLNLGAASVPEPSSLLLSAAGLLAMGYRSRRRTRHDRSLAA